ncbi:MAG: hypothetical protein RBS89_02800 [Candidatus Delongbacteria bacterium]|nr:hypothetical protein [Candidatus Delongbacteria bacterium]
MKKNKMIVTVIFAFALLTAAFAMSNDGGQQPVKQENGTDVVQAQSEQVQQGTTVTEQAGQDSQKEAPKRATIAQLEGYVLENVWPDQEKEIDVDEYEKIKEDYINKGKKLNLENWKIKYYWSNRVNLTEYENLYNLNAITKNVDAASRTIEEKALLSQIIVIGSVYNIVSDDRKNARFHTSCEIKIDEFILGKEFFLNLPSSLILNLESDYKKGIWDYEPNLVKGKKYMFFLSRYPIEDYAQNNESCKRTNHLSDYKELPDNVNLNNVFSLVSYSTIEVNNLKDSEINRMKDTFTQISEINDCYNFFDRVYDKGEIK